MSTETDVCNEALGLIGQSPITAIDDGSIPANRCLQFYAPLRDALLRSHHWNFALKWVQLAQDVTPPVAGFTFAYTLPADCLKVVNYGGSLPTSPTTIVSYIDPYQRTVVRYKIEGRKLVSNDGVAYIQYLRQVTNPAEWDGLFYQVVATWLASKLAGSLAKDPKMSAALLAQATNMIMPLALAVDGQEGSIEPYVVDDLIWGR